MTLRRTSLIGVLCCAGVVWTTAAVRTQAPAAAVTVFEGARVITGGDRPPIENAILIVRGTRFDQVGRTGDVQIPPGAARVSLAGKIVMPAIIDTHTHLSGTRDALVQDLRRRARRHESRSGRR